MLSLRVGSVQLFSWTLIVREVDLRWCPYLRCSLDRMRGHLGVLKPSC